MKQPYDQFSRKVIAIAAVSALVVVAIWLIDYFATAFIVEPIGSRSLIATVARAETKPNTGHPAALALFDPPRAIPDISFRDGDGAAHSIVNFRGKVVVLNIWASWCGPCRHEMPTLDRLQGQLGGADFQVVALSIDRAGSTVVRRFYSDLKVRHLNIYIDSSGEAARQLSAIGVPVTLLIDHEGREVARLVGSAEWDAPEMVALIRSLLVKHTEFLVPGTAHGSRRITDRLPLELDLTATGYPIVNPTNKDVAS